MLRSTTWSQNFAWIGCLLLAGCSQASAARDGGQSDDGVPSSTAEGTYPPTEAGTSETEAETEAETEGETEGEPDPECPIDPCKIIDEFPYTDSDDTASSPLANWDGYSCAPNTGELGNEVVYMFVLEESGTLVAMIDDAEGVDVDVHLLAGADAEACIERGNVGLSWNLDVGEYFLVVDAWSDAEDLAYDGEYTLRAHFLPEGSNCAMLDAPVERIGAADALSMPATGMVVREAHLVTDEEYTDGSWPQSFWEGIPEHYELSESVSGYSMERAEPWAPFGEGGSEFGQGSSAKPPPEAETWYLNMRWANAPEQGERYILFNGQNGKAVVGAAGYENGPGDLTRIGGTCEEVHDHLETDHLDTFTFGVAAFQGLPFGPIDCEQ